MSPPVHSWKGVHVGRTPGTRRALNVASWVVSICMVSLGVIHFSASFNLHLLKVTKAVFSVCVHSVSFAAQLAVPLYYIWVAKPGWDTNARAKWTVIPCLTLTAVFSLLEIVMVSVNWTDFVSIHGLGSLNSLWIVVRIFWVLVYTGVLTIGLVPIPKLPTASTSNFPQLFLPVNSCHSVFIMH